MVCSASTEKKSPSSFHPARALTPQIRTLAVITGHRYYNPTLGRWINRDPLGDIVFLSTFLEGVADEVIPEIEHLSVFSGYEMLSNSPVNYVDITGLFSYDQRDDNTLDIDLDHCDLVMIDGHGATKAVNTANPPNGEGCGARIGQDTCGNGPSHRGFPDIARIPRIPISTDPVDDGFGGVVPGTGRNSNDIDKNRRKKRALDKALKDLCNCCEQVTFVRIKHGRDGRIKPTFKDRIKGVVSSDIPGIKEKKIDCPVSEPIPGHTYH